MPRVALLCATLLFSAHAAPARAGSPTRSPRAVRAADVQASREALKAYTARHGLVIAQRGVDVHPTVALISAHRSYYGKTHDPGMEWRKADPDSKPAFVLAEGELKGADGQTRRHAIGFTDSGRLVVEPLPHGDWRERHSKPKAPSTADYQRLGLKTMGQLERAANKLLLRIAGMEGQRADEATLSAARAKVEADVREAETLSAIAGGRVAHPDLDLLLHAHEARVAAGDVRGALVLRKRATQTLSAVFGQDGRVKLVVREHDGNYADVTTRGLHAFGIRTKAALDRVLENAIAEIAPEDLAPAPR